MEWPRDDTPLHVQTVDVQGVSTDQIIISRPVWLLGWTLTEVTGVAPATVALWNGGSVNGQLIALVPLLASGLALVHPGTPGWECDSGLFLDVQAGTVSGTFTTGEFR